MVTFSKFACQHGAIHHERHHRPVHGERLLKVNNLCIFSFCFEYMDEEKIVVSIAGDRQAEKLSPLGMISSPLKDWAKNLWVQKFVSLTLVLLMNDHKIISSSCSELVPCLLSLALLCDGEGQDSAVATH